MVSWESVNQFPLISLSSQAFIEKKLITEAALTQCAVANQNTPWTPALHLLMLQSSKQINEGQNKGLSTGDLKVC